MRHPKSAMRDPLWVQVLLISIALLFLVLFLFIPLSVVFAEALAKGWSVYLDAFTEENARSAILLTLTTVAVSVPLNALFGLAAAWAVTRFEFRGKSILISLIDLPFAVPPVVSGLALILTFGPKGLVGGLLVEKGFQVIFATPGIILATVFVTFPFVARELIPLMQSQGTDQEYAALSLGASPWQMFRRVTLPNIRWALLYGIILCNARAMGEFGAVSVVSGHIRGETNTLPLHIEVLYNEYNSAAAFACASLLSLLGLATLAAKLFIEWKAARRDTHP
jgi:sulfate transport system permease protein